MLEKIHELIKIYFLMENGCHIKEYQEELTIFESEIIIKIRHRALKHIVEQRKQDNYSEDNLLKLFSDVFDVLNSNNFKIVENKDKKDIFILFEIIDNKNSGVVLVLEIVEESKNNYYIKTGFYRSARKIKKLHK